MLDNLAELVMTMGDEVVVSPAERMPTELGLAAVYQFEFTEFRKWINIGASSCIAFGPFKLEI